MAFGDDASLNVWDLDVGPHGITLCGDYLGQFSLAGKEIETNTSDRDAFLAVFEPDGSPANLVKMGGVFDDVATTLLCRETDILVSGFFLGLLSVDDQIDLTS